MKLRKTNEIQMDIPFHVFLQKEKDLQLRIKDLEAKSDAAHMSLQAKELESTLQQANEPKEGEEDREKA